MSGPTEWSPSLWLDIFDELLNDDDELDYGDDWNLNFNYHLTNSVTVQERRRGWKIHNHCAQGNFRCSSCSNTWSSVRVTVLFHYRLRAERGTVLMRPFGQACKSCAGNSFELPGFSDSVVRDSLLTLFYKIRKNCYGEVDDDDEPCTSGYRRRTKPHEASLCEACSQGICCQADDDDDDDDD